jgi:hypothetical protein
VRNVRVQWAHLDLVEEHRQRARRDPEPAQRLSDGLLMFPSVPRGRHDAALALTRADHAGASYLDPRVRAARPRFTGWTAPCIRNARPAWVPLRSVTPAVPWSPCASPSPGPS